MNCSTKAAISVRFSSRAAQRRKAASSIEELKSYIVDYEEKNENPSLGDFLENMALYTDADQSGEDEDAVIMMTMHAAKGPPSSRSCSSPAWRTACSPGFRAMEKEEDMEGGAPSVLCRCDAREEAAVPHLRRAPSAAGRTQSPTPPASSTRCRRSCSTTILSRAAASAATAPDPTLDRPQVMRARLSPPERQSRVHRSHRQKPAVPPA